MQELRDEMTGSFRIRTRSGTQYLICLDAPRHVIRFPGEAEQGTEYKNIDVAALREDTEPIPLLRVVNLTVGQRGLLALDIVGGGVVTSRDMTEVVEILPLIDHVPISDEQAEKIGQAARRLGWAGIFHIPHSSPPVFVLDASAARTPSAKSYVHLDEAITAALGTRKIILDAAEHYSDAQLADMRRL